MEKVVIIADDLTGASDTGVHLSHHGLKTSVSLDVSHRVQDVISISDAVVFDTDSRALPSETSYSIVTQLAQELKEAQIQHVFKKIDSTFRGNIGYEIDAIMDALSYDIAFVVPAFPKIGRTTRNGNLYLHSAPIHQTEIGRDPKCPVLDSYLCNLLAVQSKRASNFLSRENLHKQESGINFIQKRFSEGVQLFVIDIEEEEDFEKIIALSKEVDLRILWIGSAGVGRYIPEIFHIPSAPAPKINVHKTPKNVMLVSGSLSQVTREQVEIFSQHTTVASTKLDPSQLLVEKDRQVEIDRCKREVLSQLYSAKDVSLSVDSHIDVSDEAKQKNLSLPDLISQSLGEIASYVMRNFPLQGVILTGGDTARSVCKHLGVSALTLLDEVETGIPLSQMAGFPFLFTVTKAGAFGNPHSLLHALFYLKGELEHD